MKTQAALCLMLVVATALPTTHCRAANSAGQSTRVYTYNETLPVSGTVEVRGVFDPEIRRFRPAKFDLIRNGWIVVAEDFSRWQSEGASRPPQSAATVAEAFEAPATCHADPSLANRSRMQFSRLAGGGSMVGCGDNSAGCGARGCLPRVSQPIVGCPPSAEQPARGCPPSVGRPICPKTRPIQPALQPPVRIPLAMTPAQPRMPLPTRRMILAR